MHIVKFSLLVVIYSLLILTHGSRPLDFWLKLNLAGKWKLKETESMSHCRILSGLYLLSILHHLYEVLHGKYLKDKFYRKSFSKN